MTSQEEQTTSRQVSKPEAKSRQASVDSFWTHFYTKHPGTVSNVLPTKSFAKKDTLQATKGKAYSKRAVVTYEEAALECRQAVAKVAKECRRVNQRYRDKDFDIETDLKDGERDCLDGIDTKSDESAQPKSTKRVSVSYVHFVRLIISGAD